MKARYVLNLAQAVHDGSVPLDEVHAWEDEAIIAALTTIKGVGPWTAEMFLIFALGRPDVLSVGDLGIRVGLRDFYGLDELPGPQRVPRADRALAALTGRSPCGISGSRSTTREEVPERSRIEGGKIRSLSIRQTSDRP